MWGLRKRTLLGGALLILVLGFVVWADSAPPGWLPQHEIPNESPVAFADGMAFSAYIARTRDMITRLTRDMPYPPDRAAVEARTPREFNPDTNPACGDRGVTHGVLMVHGFFDSPATQVDVATALAEPWYLVRTLLIPGHSTVPGHMRATDVADMRAAVDYGLNSFADAVDGNLYVLGFSAGAVLLTDHILAERAGAEPHPHPDIAGFIALSPAFLNMDSGFDVRSVALSLLGGFRRFAYDGLGRGENPIKYDSYPFATYGNFLSLSQAIALDADPAPLMLPSLMIMVEQDVTVPYTDAVAYVCGRYPGSDKLVFTQNAPEAVATPCDGIMVEQMRDEEIGVLGPSHIALPMAPENPFFGIDGVYRDCAHYSRDDTKYAACWGDDAAVKWGERTAENIAAVPVLRRLSFNPAFQHMLVRITDFIAEHGGHKQADQMSH